MDIRLTQPDGTSRNHEMTEEQLETLIHNLCGCGYTAQQEQEAEGTLDDVLAGEPVTIHGWTLEPM